MVVSRRDRLNCNVHIGNVKINKLEKFKSAVQESMKEECDTEIRRLIKHIRYWKCP